jgi:RHS repeat-associated protein
VFDIETGLAQNWNREYRSALGGYVESDPIGLEGGINPYSYAFASPLSVGDPMGLDGGGAGVTVMTTQSGARIMLYAGPQAGGTEHARQGPGENYHAHIKSPDGREFRISTETWRPLTPDDAEKYNDPRNRDLKRACESLNEGQKRWIDRLNREVFHSKRPNLKLVMRLNELNLRVRGIVVPKNE